MKEQVKRVMGNLLKIIIIT